MKNIRLHGKSGQCGVQGCRGARCKEVSPLPTYTPRDYKKIVARMEPDGKSILKPKHAPLHATKWMNDRANTEREDVSWIKRSQEQFGNQKNRDERRSLLLKYLNNRKEGKVDKEAVRELLPFLTNDIMFGSALDQAKTLRVALSHRDITLSEEQKEVAEDYLAVLKAS